MMGDYILQIWNLISRLFLIVNNMFYPGTSLTDNCYNSNVEIVDNLSYDVSWYVPDLSSYVILWICQGQEIVIIDPFLEVPPSWSSHMGLGQGSRVTKGSWCNVKWVYYQEIPAEEFQRSIWTTGWCSILLVDKCVYIYSLFPPQCRNELRPHEFNVTVCDHRHPILILVLKEVWPDDAISFNYTPHSHFLLAKRAMDMFMGLSLSPEAHILLVDVPTQVTVSPVTKEIQIQQASVIFSPLTDILTKCFLFCFIVISLPLKDLNFVRKELKAIMQYPQNWCSRNANSL